MSKARTSWQTLPEEQQLALAQHAMRQAALILAEQAELFASQFALGAVADRGGAESLRLFAALVRATAADQFGAVGHA